MSYPGWALYPIQNWGAVLSAPLLLPVTVTSPVIASVSGWPFTPYRKVSMPLVYGTVTEHVWASRLNIGTETSIGPEAGFGFVFSVPPCAAYETHSPWLL